MCFQNKKNKRPEYQLSYVILFRNSSFVVNALLIWEKCIKARITLFLSLVPLHCFLAGIFI